MHSVRRPPARRLSGVRTVDQVDQLPTAELMRRAAAQAVRQEQADARRRQEDRELRARWVQRQAAYRARDRRVRRGVALAVVLVAGCLFLLGYLALQAGAGAILFGVVVVLLAAGGLTRGGRRCITEVVVNVRHWH